jgi:hypothetical protein
MRWNRGLNVFSTPPLISVFMTQVSGKAVNWDVQYYDILQNTVGGGKPKMKWFRV